MSFEFRLQDPGEGIHEAEIVEIVVKEGQHVEEGDNILVAETDKAAVDIPSPVTGALSSLKVAEGDIVEVGQVLAIFDEEEAAGEERDAGGDERDKDNPFEEKAGKAADDDAETGKGAGSEKSKQAEEIAGSVRRESPEAEDSGSRPQDEATSDADGEDRGGRTRGNVLATPAVRGLSRELGVDLTEISGSGEEGRVLDGDVREAAESGSGGRDEPTVEIANENTERVKLRSIRRSTARQMSRAWAEIPHVTHQDEIDITGLEKLRRAHTEDAEQSGAKLTLTPFIIKALAGSLSEHPRFNARYHAEGEEIELIRDVNVGVALDTERGLLVPVIRNVPAKTVLELSGELALIADKLKQQRADRAMLEGGTITLTNIGSIGGTGFMPIINPPQVAIFGTARARLKNVMSGDIDKATSSTRLILPVCLTFDHRVNDGADAARFMNSVKQLLSDLGEFALRS